MKGRPLSLTETVADALVDALGAGATYRDASALAGVSPSSVFSWLARGRSERERIEQGDDPLPGEAPFLDLLDRVTRACAELSVEVNRAWLAAVRGGDWRAAAAWVERHRRAVDDPVDQLDPEQVAERTQVRFTERQGRVIADAFHEYARSLLTVAEDDGVPAARSRQGQIARQVLLAAEGEHRDL